MPCNMEGDGSLQGGKHDVHVTHPSKLDYVRLRHTNVRSKVFLARCYSGGTRASNQNIERRKPELTATLALYHYHEWNFPYLCYKVSYVSLIEAFHLRALCYIVHHWQDMATAQQMDEVIHKTLLQLKLEGKRRQRLNNMTSCLCSISTCIPR